MCTSIRRKLCMAVLLASGIVCAEARESCPPAPIAPTHEQIEAGAENARDRGFLWRISKEGRTSYLYGTMHIAKFEWMFPGKEVAKALHATDTVALELDILDPDIKRRMDRGMRALRGTQLPESLVLRMRKLAQSVCVPYESVANLPPELQLVMLSIWLARRDGLEPAYAIDAFLAAAGRGAKKDVISLETPESQLDALQMENPEETISLVKEDLDELEKRDGNPFFEQVAKIWGESDYEEMSRFEEWCNCLNTDAERKMMKRLLDDRNPNLAKGIDALHKNGKEVFAAVGSLHMFGPLALPLLMEKRGYKVERVELKAAAPQ